MNNIEIDITSISLNDLNAFYLKYNQIFSKDNKINTTKDIDNDWNIIPIEYDKDDDDTYNDLLETVLNTLNTIIKEHVVIPNCDECTNYENMDLEQCNNNYEHMECNSSDTECNNYEHMECNSSDTACNNYQNNCESIKRKISICKTICDSKKIKRSNPNNMVLVGGKPIVIKKSIKSSFLRDSTKRARPFKQSTAVKYYNSTKTQDILKNRFLLQQLQKILTRSASRKIPKA